MATEVDPDYDETGDDEVQESYEAEDEDGPVAELNVDDSELEAIRARVREMEEEAKKIRAMQNEVEKQMNSSSTSSLGSPLPMSVEEKLDADFRSIWIGNVDYGATAEELELHFNECGPVHRVTILCDKFSGHPKGFAYIEFADKESVQLSMGLDDSLFRGRQIKVTPKRTNRPGISSTNRPPRGRFGRPRPSYYAPRYARPRGRFRPRRSVYYSPY